MQAALRGEAWAKEALFRRYVKMVHAMVVRLSGYWQSDPEDVTQDVFTEAFASLGRLRQPEYVGSWLGSIAVNLVRRNIKRRVLRSRFKMDSPDPSALDAALSGSAPPDVVLELRQVYRIVEDLPEQVRTAFLLRHVEGLKIEEVATAMSASISSVKRWLKAAKHRIDRASTVNSPRGVLS